MGMLGFASFGSIPAVINAVIRRRFHYIAFGGDGAMHELRRFDAD
jgi:hypothetical protein